MRPILAILTVAGVLSASSAIAMPHCGDRDAVIAALSGQYTEHHVASGLQSATGLMEIWASADNGTWTILMTRPDGQTCIVANGTHWLERPEQEMVSGDPA